MVEWCSVPKAPWPRDTDKQHPQWISGTWMSARLAPSSKLDGCTGHKTIHEYRWVCPAKLLEEGKQWKGGYICCMRVKEVNHRLRAGLLPLWAVARANWTIWKSRTAGLSAMILLSLSDPITCLHLLFFWIMHQLLPPTKSLNNTLHQTDYMSVDAGAGPSNTASYAFTFSKHPQTIVTNWIKDVQMNEMWWACWQSPSGGTDRKLR